MDKTQTLLVELLSLAIRDSQPHFELAYPIDWRLLFEEATAHQVHALLFSLVTGTKFEQEFDQNLKSQWQKETLLSISEQMQHIGQITKVIQSFYIEGIPFIALKGLLLRDLYPQAEFRTMGDADLLLHKEDIDRAKALLIPMGYQEVAYYNSKHLCFYHDNFPSIELHWFLTDQHIFTNTKDYEHDVWNNAMPIQFFGVPCLSLSVEDQLLHLLLHMACHMKGNGFGLRQLCDIVLYIEANNSLINWNTIEYKTAHLNIDIFTHAIITLCHRFFHMAIPEIYAEKTSIDDSVIELLMIDILSAGVFGKRDFDRTISTIYRNYITNPKTGQRFPRLKWVISFLFPPAKQLKHKYSYITKLPILLPLAWIHRFVYNLLRKDILTIHKTSFLSSQAINTYKERFKLLQLLKLH